MMWSKHYSCGCINEVHESGALYCVHKCDDHVGWLITHSEDTREHYASMSCLVNGIPQSRKYIKELTEIFDSLDYSTFQVSHNPSYMLEVGCGLGMYVPYFLKKGWEYEAIEVSRYAAYWTKNCFDVKVYEEPFEAFQHDPYDMIFGAHVFEHLKDAPAMFRKAYDLISDGGRLVIIIPDDTDPLNPSHWWFFNQDSLRALLESVGFGDIRMIMRKIVPQENFIYCVADKK